MSITTALESVWPPRVGGAKGGVVCDYYFLERRHDDDRFLGGSRDD